MDTRIDRRRLFVLTGSAVVAAAFPRGSLATPGDVDLADVFEAEPAAKLRRIHRYYADRASLGSLDNTGVERLLVHLLRERDGGREFGDNTARYTVVLGRLPVVLPSLGDDDVAAAITALGIDGKFFKEDVARCVFADPVAWRGGRGAQIWQLPGIGLSPIYPCADRSDVRRRRMRSEARSALIVHLDSPADRRSAANRGAESAAVFAAKSCR